jgi:hypothetical protein
VVTYLWGLLDSLVLITGLPIEHHINVLFDGYHLENEISIANILDVQYITDL